MEKKYQDALNKLVAKTGILNDTCCHLEKCLITGKCYFQDRDYETYDCTDYETAALLQKLADKETPKKPIKKHYEDEGEPEYIKECCPNGCRISFSSNWEKYCPICGQKLDWSESADG